MELHMNHSMSDNTSMPADHSHHTTMNSHIHHHHTTTTGHQHHDPAATGGHEDHTGATHTMQMFFHTGVSEYILFEPLLTKDAKGLVAACFVVFFLSVMYEALKYFREYLLRRVPTHQGQAYAVSNGDVKMRQPEVGSRMLTGSHALQTVLHMVQVFVSYCLMLVFMTYNAYLCLAVILGAGLGYFLFGWRRTMVVDINEHCH